MTKINVERLFDDEDDVENTMCTGCPHDLDCDTRCPALKYIIDHCIKNMKQYEKWANNKSELDPTEHDCLHPL